MSWIGLTSSNGTTTLIDFDKVNQVVSYRGGSIIFFVPSGGGIATKEVRQKVFVREPLDKIAKLLKAKIA